MFMQPIAACAHSYKQRDNTRKEERVEGEGGREDAGGGGEGNCRKCL